jgi:hypothetical protein
MCLYKSIFIAVLFFLFVPQVASAEIHTSVSISNNGQGASSNVSVSNNSGSNTVCQNGNCTTSSNNQNQQSTVCINGSCQTSTGNVNITQNQGNTHVSIQNNALSPATPVLPVSPAASVSPVMSASDQPTQVMPTHIPHLLTDRTPKSHNFFTALMEKIQQLKMLFFHWW